MTLDMEDKFLMIEIEFERNLKEVIESINKSFKSIDESIEKSFNELREGRNA